MSRHSAIAQPYETRPRRSSAARSGAPWLGLLDPEPVPGRVADRGVADTPGLAGGFGEHLDAGGLGDLGERSVEVVDPEMDGVELALRQLGGDRIAVLLRAAGMRLREDDADLGLALGDEGDPAKTALLDLELHGQAERVAVEGEGRVGIVDEDVNGA